ncbi:MAG: KH domain-containing protein [Actinomycetota bacterium]|nr:KH domain-containing protein [Actinomycetota bacterium]
MSRALLEYVGPWLVDHPDDFNVVEIEGERGAIVLELTVNPEDTGKVIGRNGRIIRSLRTLARAAGQREGQTFFVEVVD